jgi:hypothetical protein
VETWPSYESGFGCGRGRWVFRKVFAEVGGLGGGILVVLFSSKLGMYSSIAIVVWCVRCVGGLVLNGQVFQQMPVVYHEISLTPVKDYSPITKNE